MSVDRLCAHYGLTRTPFGRDLAPAQLHRSAAHNEAVARLGWLIAERGLGTLTGEVGCGKTRRRPRRRRRAGAVPPPRRVLPQPLRRPAAACSL